MRTTPTLSRLIAKLRAPDSYTRQLAVESLDGMGAKAVPVLVEFLRDENFYVRGHAARVLGNIGFQAKAAIPLLIEALKDPDSFVRGHAARALGNIGFQAKAAIPLLIEALKDPDSFVSINAAEALGNIGPQAKAAIPALAKALKSWNDEVCKSAANALKNIGSASIPILQTLEEGNPYIRRYMVKMLGEMGIEAKEAMLALIEALYDPDLRDKAVEALKCIFREISTTRSGR